MVDWATATTRTGNYHSLVLTVEGKLFSFGFGGYGQLGHGDMVSQSQPKRVAALANEQVVRVAAGNHHSLALTVEGTRLSFGHGDYGQLGHGDTADQLQPQRVVSLPNGRVVRTDMAAGPLVAVSWHSWGTSWASASVGGSTGPLQWCANSGCVAAGS